MDVDREQGPGIVSSKRGNAQKRKEIAELLRVSGQRREAPKERGEANAVSLKGYERQALAEVNVNEVFKRKGARG